MVDDGDGLCKDGEICSRGVCLPKCGTGEFRCPAGLTCATDGLCIDAACKDKVCPDGSRVCSAGDCVDACTGITCPHGRACRNGGCVDPCVGITCDDGFACVDGACTSCECSACTDGTVCSATPQSAEVKLCVDSGCEAKTCTTGTHCKAGDCVDDCDGAMCPQGQACSKGECIADGSAMSGTGGTDGSGLGGTGIVIVTGGTDGTGAIGTGGASSNGNNPAQYATGQKACNCTVPGGSSGGAGALSLMTLLGLVWHRRRRNAA